MEKNLIDESVIPAKDRPWWLKLNVFSGWVAAGALFVFLLRCYGARVNAEKQHAGDIIRARIEERSRARTEYIEDEERKLKEIHRKEAEIREYFNRLDSLKRKI